MHIRSAVMVVAVMTATTTACQTSRPLTSADEAAIRAADSSFHAAINAGSVEGATAFYAADGVVMPPNMPPARGTDAIRQLYSGLFGMMNVTITVQSERVAGEGNLAYQVGSYHFTGTLKDSAQTPLPPEDGKYIQVFLRQADGSWKAVVDAWSANTPPPAPAAPSPRRR